ncbi:MAG TPA: sugar ABC transporter permease [Candidatus Ventricola gallistercoris]|nr:sugar ABC transporter permease [Candidatus Ventricola gallistercoris]
MFEKKKSVLFFLLPGLLMLLIFYIVPFVSGIGHSLTDGSYKNEFVGFQNYINLWQNSMFQLGLKNTMELSLICAPLLWVLSFLLASALAAIKPYGGFFRSSVLLPYLAPSSAILLIWLVVFDYGGPVNRLMEAMGMQRVLWLSSGALRFPVVLMFLWKNLGFCLIIFLAALQSIPEPLYEYAKLEGAGFITRAFRITLPLITPSAFLVFVLAWINAFKIFKEVYFIAGAYPDYSVYTLQNYMNNMFEKLNYQNVTAAAYTFGLIVFGIFGLLFFIQRRAARGLN